MNYVIIEDEIHNAQLLAKYVQQIQVKANLLQIIPSISETVHWFQHHDMPDLLFMDIRLEDGLSFEIFNQIEFTCPIYLQPHMTNMPYKLSKFMLQHIY